MVSFLARDADVDPRNLTSPYESYSPARLGYEKPHEAQELHTRTDHPQPAHF